LHIQVSVHVDEPGGHDLPVYIERTAGGAHVPVDQHHSPIGDCDIGPTTRSASAIDDLTTPHHKIVHRFNLHERQLRTNLS
jgi:hypothetical protein